MMCGGPKYFLLIISFLALQSCNTLYNSRTINLEVLVPGKVMLNPGYRSLAVMYNNANIAPNPLTGKYVEDGNEFADIGNTDSIASKIYFDVFVDQLIHHSFFDTVLVIPATDHSKTCFIDSLVTGTRLANDSNSQMPLQLDEIAVHGLASAMRSYLPPKPVAAHKIILDPKFGSYSRENIQLIADSTGADLFLSLDLFAAIDGIFMAANFLAIETVHIYAAWGIYDLQKEELLAFYAKNDTINWTHDVANLRQAKRFLPPRKDAVFNAADLAATRFAGFLVPHWIEVERMYYRSGQVELRKTEAMVEENNWLEAAKIWKANTENPNKAIAAKSMFNLALASEIFGDLDAAIDWAVKSFYVLNQKNEIHALNCRNYIQILGQRKYDIEQIENLTR